MSHPTLWFFFLCLSILLCWHTTYAYATTRYVATTGSDGVSCAVSASASTPKRNLGGASGAVACMAGGDTLIVGDGGYAEGLDLLPSGSPGNPTTVRGASVKGARIRPNNIGVDCVVLFHNNQAWVTIDGLILDGSNGSGTRLSGWAVCQTDAGTAGTGANHLTVQNSELTLSRHSGMLIGGTVWTVRNNEIHHNGTDTTFDHGIYFEANNSFIVGNSIHDNACYNLQVYSSAGANPTANTITQNIFSGSRCGVTLPLGANHLFANNLSYNDATTSSACALIGFGTNTKVYNNTITGSSGCGLTTNAGNDNGVEVTNNIVYNNAGGNISVVHATLSHNLTTNPSFANPAAGDYTLQASSAAVNTGVTLASVPTDLLGVPRPQGSGYDIGAYELRGSGGLTPQVGTYYISVSGTDTQTCADAQNIATPKRTLNNTLPCGSSGSTFYLRAGTYTESIDTSLQPIAAGVSWANPTTIAAYQSEVAVLQATSGVPIIFLRNPTSDHYLLFDKLQLDGFSIPSTNGLAIYPGVDHIRFQNGEIKRTYYEAVFINQGANIEVLTSNIHDILNIAAINVIGNADSILHGNTIFNSAKGGIAATSTINSNLEISGNTLYATGTAVASPAIGVKDGSSGLVANNLIYGSYAGIQVLSPSVGERIYNNTITGNTNVGLQVDTGASGIRLTNNIVYNNGSGIINNGTGTVQTTNLTTDPLFVNASVNNYQLQSGSAAKNTGTTLSDVLLDILNVPRPPGAYDIGAYESVGGGAPTRPPTGLIFLGLN